MQTCEPVSSLQFKSFITKTLDALSANRVCVHATRLWHHLSIALHVMNIIKFWSKVSKMGHFIKFEM